MHKKYTLSGFLFDLCDNNTYNIANNLFEVPGITDNCRGYTPALIYSKMGPTTITATGLMNKLDNNLPTGTTQADYDALRQSYGY